ncbi:MAG: ABC transporter ATP-binding protein [Lachnospiraceae bacterium]|nr:ABC transporter ATP-binding protein [Lachnospiraceae bacterium]
MNGPVLACKDVTIGYGSRIVASHIDLEVMAGESVALIGENGSGKSTLLKTLIKEIPPIAGKVLVGGKDIKALSAHDIAGLMSIVMTGSARPEYFTCYDMVASGRYPYTDRLGRLKETDRMAVEEAMRVTGTSDIATRYVTDISDGQRQLVMLGRAIAQEPELLILDEPTNFLDIRHKILFTEAVQKLVSEKGTAVLMSTHELDIVRKMTDRFVALKDGKTDFCGNTDRLTEEYIMSLFRL